MAYLDFLQSVNVPGIDLDAERLTDQQGISDVRLSERFLEKALALQHHSCRIQLSGWNKASITALQKGTSLQASAEHHPPKWSRETSLLERRSKAISFMRNR